MTHIWVTQQQPQLPHNLGVVHQVDYLTIGENSLELLEISMEGHLILNPTYNLKLSLPSSSSSVTYALLNSMQNSQNAAHTFPPCEYIWFKGAASPWCCTTKPQFIEELCVSKLSSQQEFTETLKSLSAITGIFFNHYHSSQTACPVLKLIQVCVQVVWLVSTLLTPTGLMILAVFFNLLIIFMLLTLSLNCTGAEISNISNCTGDLKACWHHAAVWRACWCVFMCPFLFLFSSFTPFVAHVTFGDVVDMHLTFPTMTAVQHPDHGCDERSMCTMGFLWSENQLSIPPQ